MISEMRIKSLSLLLVIIFSYLVFTVISTEGSRYLCSGSCYEFDIGCLAYEDCFSTCSSHEGCYRVRRLGRCTCALAGGYPTRCWCSCDYSIECIDGYTYTKTFGQMRGPNCTVIR